MTLTRYNYLAGSRVTTRPNPPRRRLGRVRPKSLNSLRKPASKTRPELALTRKPDELLRPDTRRIDSL